MTVLNPFRRVDERIMDDADLAGPLIFCFCFATFLLFVRVLLPHGASPPLTTCAVRQATIRVYLRTRAIGLHQPLLSSKPDVRAGYRCLPRALGARVLFAAHGWRRRTQRHCHVGVRKLKHFFLTPRADSLVRSGMLGYVLSSLSIVWCTYAASGIFVAVLRMSDQRLLVAYPVGLLYGCFALLSVFNVGGSK
jgi:hypothetical protein